MAFAIRLIIDAGVCVIAMGLAIGYGGSIDQEFDLLSHARFHLAVGAVVCAGVYVIISTRRRAWIALAIAGIGLAGTVPWLVGASSARPSDSHTDAGTFRLMTFNVQGAFRDPDATLAAILGADPDIVIMPEFWASVGFADRLRSKYPYLAQCPISRSCKVAILSRIALLQPPNLEAGLRTTAATIAQVSINGQIVSVFGIHASWPFAGQAQGIDLDAIADMVRTVEGRLVVAGDFNATPWSRLSRQFVNRSGLYRLGGYRATWPNTLGPFGIPIDHAFYRGDVDIRDVRAVAGWAGSDHRPLVMTVEVY